MTDNASPISSTNDLLQQALQNAYDRGFRDGVAKTQAEIREALEDTSSSDAAYSVCDVFKTAITAENIDITPDARLYALSLSERAQNCFTRAQIYSLDDLMKMSGREILAITNFGHKSLIELVERFDELSLRVPKTWRNEAERWSHK